MSLDPAGIPNPGESNEDRYRREALADVLKFSEPLDELQHLVQSLPWDWDGEPLAIVTEQVVVNAIDRYLHGEISADELSRWAGLFEVRDDVDYPAHGAEELKQLVFELANPLINRAIVPDGAKEFRQRAIAAVEF